MPSATPGLAPGLSTFLASLKGRDVESSIELFISLLKRRQIRNSRPCAIATANLLLRVAGEFQGKDPAKLVERIRSVGQRLIAAQPREMVVGNIVRRVLNMVRLVIQDVEEGDDSANVSEAARTPLHSPKRPRTASTISSLSPTRHEASQPTELLTFDGILDLKDLPSRPPLLTSHTSYALTGAPTVTSLFTLFSQPGIGSGTSTPPGYHSPVVKSVSFTDQLFKKDTVQVNDIKTDVVEGIREILEELDVVDEQIAAYALDHIHSNEIILTHTSSLTVQRFLLTAARKRKFTVVHVEGHPNESHQTHDTLLNGAKSGETKPDDAMERFKPLTSAGITVILIPDSAVFAIMSRINKVILATRTVLANGGLVAACGAKVIAQAAKSHQIPVVVLSGVYKLSPIYPFDVDELIEYGDAGAVANYEEKDFVEQVDVVNPLYDYVGPGLVDLYISNLGGHAPSYLYHVVADHYHVEDISL